MAVSKVKFLQTSVRSFKSTIEGTPRSSQEIHVSISLAGHYNSLLAQATKFDELKEHLPPQINEQSMFSITGVTDSTYTDLMVYLNQLISLTDLLEDK